MRIQVLGVGGAFSPELGNSSLVLWDKGTGFLIDCGYTVYPILKEKKLIEKINKVFITHRHGDHAGSLDTFLYHKRYILSQKVKFFGVSTHLEYLKQIDPKFEKDFDQYFVDTGETITTLPTNHAEGVPSEAFYNYGLLYSGDTAESLLDTPQAFEAKKIFHEVTFGDKGGVHTTFAELARASDKIKRKTWVYHYNEGDYDAHESKVRLHGFAGLLKKDQIIEI